MINSDFFRKQQRNNNLPTISGVICSNEDDDVLFKLLLLMCLLLPFVVEEGDAIVAGSLIAKTPRQAAKTKDITGGLPRVAELFEARIPKDGSEISKIDGVVDFGATVRGKRSIIIRDVELGERVLEERLPPGMRTAAQPR